QSRIHECLIYTLDIPSPGLEAFNEDRLGDRVTAAEHFGIQRGRSCIRTLADHPTKAKLAGVLVQSFQRMKVYDNRDQGVLRARRSDGSSCQEIQVVAGRKVVGGIQSNPRDRMKIPFAAPVLIDDRADEEV